MKEKTSVTKLMLSRAEALLRRKIDEKMAEWIRANPAPTPQPLPQRMVAADLIKAVPGSVLKEILIAKVGNDVSGSVYDVRRILLDSVPAAKKKYENAEMERDSVRKMNEAAKLDWEQRRTAYFEKEYKRAEAILDGALFGGSNLLTAIEQFS